MMSSKTLRSPFNSSHLFHSPPSPTMASTSSAPILATPLEINLIKKKTIVSETGKSSDVQDNLVKFLQWQVKATNSCFDAERDYRLCRRYTAGSGTYCGMELTTLYNCLKQG